MKKKGVSIIFISHFLEDVFRLSDRVTVLKDGLNNGVFYRGHYTKDDLVVAMMGKKIANEVSDTLTISEDAPVILELQNFTSEKKFSNVSIKIHKGDIVGVCGLLGAGKTELAKAILV